MKDFFCTSHGILNKIKIIIQYVPVFFPSNQVSMESAKLRIASKLILRSRKIFPRLDYLDCSNTFFFNRRCLLTFITVFILSSYASWWKEKPRNRSVIVVLADGKFCFFKGRNISWSCSVRQTCVRISRIQSSKHNKIFYTVVCFFFAQEIWSPFYFALI